MKYAKRNHVNTQRGLLIALCVVLALILVFLIGVVVVLEKYKSYQDMMNYTEKADITKHPLYLQMRADGELIEDSDEIINILLVGQDAREGESRQRSDAMILLTVNLNSNNLTMTSFMRDLYVEIPEHGSNRLNAAYAMGGADLLNLTLLKNFGIVVDANIEVDFQGFMKAIDTVGGIDVELSQDEVNFLQANGNWGVSNSAGTWNLKVGKNHLTGDQALAYCRDRFSDGTADFGRTQRQRKVLSALINKCKNLSVGEMDALLKQVLPLMTTNMTTNQMDFYVTKLLPMLSKLHVDQLRLPADGAYSNDVRSGMSVLVPDLAENKRILKDAILK